MRSTPDQPRNQLRNLSSYRLRDFQAELAKTPEGLKTGFASLDKLVTIPQAAVTIVCGRTGHGKTTMMFNLLVNMSRMYKDKAFVFFSYEEPRRQLGLKLLNILCGTIVDPESLGYNLAALEDYVRKGRTDNPTLEKGKAELGELLNSDRVLLEDEPYAVGDWAETVAAICGQVPVGAVFVDYMQKVRIQGEFMSRQRELERISERILDTAKSLSVPVILGAQLVRSPAHPDRVALDDLHGAGDIEQDAQVALGLFNRVMEEAQEESVPDTDSVTELEVTVLKNRNGPANGRALLDFNRALLTLSEPEASPAPQPASD
ncbi:MAG TPA: DnaB-like helicase C-terminal domain-containing protein [bacterium]|nr:DnaB-like helicase C-terminal domain-containing protein [bacterium]